MPSANVDLQGIQKADQRDCQTWIVEPAVNYSVVDDIFGEEIGKEQQLDVFITTPQHWDYRARNARCFQSLNIFNLMYRCSFAIRIYKIKLSMAYLVVHSV